MRRRLVILFLIIIIMPACAPKSIEPEAAVSVFVPDRCPVGQYGGYAPEPPGRLMSSPATNASVAAFSESYPQWLEVSAKPEKEAEQPYAETVAVPDGTPTSLGVFTVTAYCECVKCNGKWTGHKLNTPTQAGLRYPVVGYTISVDPSVIPLGSVVELEGLGARFAQDTGSAIKGNKIDLFLGSHEEALEFGVKKLEVWVYES